MPLSEAVIDCGEGDDTVIADRRDLRVTNFIDCESIIAGVAQSGRAARRAAHRRPAAELIDGSYRNDNLLGGGGDDAVLGHEGDDVMWGDHVPGSTGNDTMQAGPGRRPDVREQRRRLDRRRRGRRPHLRRHRRRHHRGRPRQRRDPPRPRRGLGRRRSPATTGCMPSAAARTTSSTAARATTSRSWTAASARATASRSGTAEPLPAARWYHCRWPGTPPAGGSHGRRQADPRRLPAAHPLPVHRRRERRDRLLQQGLRREGADAPARARTARSATPSCRSATP